MQGNTRILYVPREGDDLEERVVRALEAGPGASVTLNGDAADAYSGQIIAFVLPSAGFAGFAKLPEPDTQVGGSSGRCAAEARVVKVTVCNRLASISTESDGPRLPCPQAFKAVPVKSFDAFKGLFCNPTILSVPLGKKVSELRDHDSNKWPYSPESANEALNKLWLEAEGSFTR